jgi:hypothetical protein
MDGAADELLALEPDGLQLTPGNAPSTGFVETLSERGITTRTHHGFTPKALRRPVWSATGDCLTAADSLHPPRKTAPEWPAWEVARAGGAWRGRCLETMYPGYALGDGGDLDAAMDERQPLAVDVSHLYMQLHAGALSGATLRRLFNYEQVREVHVSANDGRRDQHRPLESSTFGLPWARERLHAGTPVIVECYMHRLDIDARRRQVDLLRAA